MGRPADGNPPVARRLGFRHGARGDAAGNEGAELAVSLIPGRDVSRPHLDGWWGARRDAFGRRFTCVVAIAAAAIAVLAMAAVAGVAPLAASAAIAVMVPAAVIDIEQRRIPDEFVLASLVALVVALSFGPADVGSWAATAGGSLTMAVPVLVVHLVSPNAMGFGDVKASVVLGAAVGTVDWRLGMVALCLAALAGGAAGLLRRRRTIPFGPFLVFGAWTVVLAHEPIVDALFVGASRS